MFGERENRVVAVTEDGHIFLYSLTYGKERGIVADYQVGLIKSRRKEYCNSIAVCEKNEFVCVETSSGIYSSSRIIILRISSQNTITETASIDEFRQKIQYKYALESAGYLGGHLFWVGIPMGGFVQLFDYDTKTGEFRELVDKRVPDLEQDPMKLHRLGDKFYYAGNLGKLVSLSLSD